MISKQKVVEALLDGGANFLWLFQSWGLVQNGGGIRGLHVNMPEEIEQMKRREAVN